MIKESQSVFGPLTSEGDSNSGYQNIMELLHPHTASIAGIAIIFSLI